MTVFKFKTLSPKNIYLDLHRSKCLASQTTFDLLAPHCPNNLVTISPQSTISDVIQPSGMALRILQDVPIVKYHLLKWVVSNLYVDTDAKSNQLFYEHGQFCPTFKASLTSGKWSDSYRWLVDPQTFHIISIKWKVRSSFIPLVGPVGHWSTQTHTTRSPTLEHLHLSPDLCQCNFEYIDCEFYT